MVIVERQRGYLEYTEVLYQDEKNDHVKMVVFSLIKSRENQQDLERLNTH